MDEFLTIEQVSKLVFKNKTRYLNTIKRHIFNSDDAEDCFQDCTINLLSKSIPSNNSESFISTCFWNYGIDRARSLMTKPGKYSIDEFTYLTFVSDYQADNSIVDFENNLEIELLISILNKVKISEFVRKTIEISYLSEKSYVETAKILDVSIFTVKNSLHRGIEIIRTYIDDNRIKSSLFKRRAVLYGSPIKQHKDGRINFTDEEREFIRVNWNKKTNSQVLNYLNYRRERIVSISALKYAAKRIVESKKRQHLNIDELTAFELSYIKNNYLTKSDRIISKYLTIRKDRSRDFQQNTIYNIRTKLDLHRSIEDNKQILKLQLKKAKPISSTRNSLGRYIDQGKNTKKERTPKVIYDFGHISHIEEPRAGRTIKRFRIKVNGKWKYYANYVWESAYGKVPDGFKLRYKDHDPNEPTIEKVNISNMELVSNGTFIKENALKRKCKMK